MKTKIACAITLLMVSAATSAVPPTKVRVINTVNNPIHIVVTEVAQRKLLLFSTADVILPAPGVGRIGLNDLCVAADPAASFCSEQRLINAINTTGVEYAAGFQGGWLDDPPDFIDTTCSGWRSSSGAFDGGTITDTGAMERRPCSLGLLPVVCCM